MCVGECGCARVRAAMATGAQEVASGPAPAPPPSRAGPA